MSTDMPVRRWRLTVCLALVALLGALVAVAGTPARGDVTTVSVDTMRTGWDAHEGGLQAASKDFGQLFDTQLQGSIFAQPLVVGATRSSPGVLIVATEADLVYGLNPKTGTVLWQRRVGTPWSPAVVGCGDFSFKIGVTSTPVYDPASGYLYVVGKDDGKTRSGASDPQHPHWRMYALNPTTGAVRPGWPVTIGGTFSNDPAHRFNAKTAGQRTGLLLLDGVVYVAFASYCDAGPFVGSVAGVSTSSARQTTLWSAEAGTHNGEAGIWQSGGGLVSDGPGQILLTTGNGTTAPPSSGFQPPAALGEAVVRLQVGNDGNLAPTDYFSPVNNTALNTDDTDLGSGGPMAIPGTFAGRHLLFQVGKDGRVFLLDRDDLGGKGQGADGGDAVLDVAGPYNGVWGHPAYWPGPNRDADNGGYIYDIENQGYLRVFQIAKDGSGDPVLTSVGTSTATFGYTSGSPVVTSDGTAAGSALVWGIYTAGPYSGNAELRAYDATPHGGVLDQVLSEPIGTAEKFAVPGTDGNRVFVGTHYGQVYGFGSPTGAAVEAAPTDFGPVPVGDTSHPVTVDVQATQDVVIAGISTTGDFAVTDAPATPVHLSSGQTLPVPLAFSPQVAGARDGKLVVETTVGGHSKPVYLDLFGRGTQPGVAANPGSLAFGTVPTSAQKTFTVNVVNTSTVPEQVHASLDQSGAPSAPFHLAISDSSSEVAGGGSVALSVTYAPTVAESDTATLSVTSDAGPGATTATVEISGTSVSGAAHLSLSPSPLQFGPIVVGTTKTKRFLVRNTGNVALTISKAPPPVGEFTTADPVAEGFQLPPGEGVRVPITFAPTGEGQVVGIYQITSDDGRGTQVEVFQGTGVDPIADRYQRLGGAGSSLGARVGRETSVGSGRMQRYRHGRIYWSAATGAHVLTGAVLRHYLALGGPVGFARFPTTDVKRTGNRHGTYATFAGAGTTGIYHSPHTGTWEVNGGIRLRWLKLHGVHSRLGYPVSDERAAGHGRRRSRFEHGKITWSHRTGRTTVSYRRSR